MLRRNHFNRFKKSPKSPFDEMGPNAIALRRGLEWLERHGGDIPSRHPAAEPAPSVPDEPQAQTQAPDNPQPSAETEITEPEALKLEPPEPEVSEPAVTDPDGGCADTSTHRDDAELQHSEPKPSSRKTEVTQASLETDSIETELADFEELKAEEALFHSGQHAPRPLLDARRFPVRYSTPNPERHERLCAICHHDERDAIEQAFLQWRRTIDIRYEFHLPSRNCIYRHAHVMGLFEKRANAVRFVLENVMEESSAVESTGDTMVRAVRAYSCLDHRGRWVEPPRRVIISRELLPAPPPKPLKKRSARLRKSNSKSRRTKSNKANPASERR